MGIKITGEALHKREMTLQQKKTMSVGVYITLIAVKTIVNTYP